MAAVVGALRVVLGADTAAFDKGLKGATASLGSFGKAAGAGVAAVAVAVTAAAVSIGVAIKNTLNHMDDIGKMSQKLGIPVEELTKLEYAAELADVSMETLSAGVGKLSKAMVAAQQNAAGPMGQAFRALGVSVTDTDGNLKSTTQVMTEVAGKFANMEDGAGKTAMAMTLFGKSGKELIPLLNAGAAGLASMFVEAEKLGLVFSEQDAKAAETFNDALTTLSRVWTGFMTQVAIALAGPLANIAESLKDTAVEAGGLTEAGQQVGKWLVEFLDLTLRGVAIVFRFADAMRITAQAISEIKSGELIKAWNTLQEVPGEKINATIQGWRKEFATPIDATGFFGEVATQVEIPGQKIDATIKNWRREFATPIDATGFFRQIATQAEVPGQKLNATILGWRTQFAIPIDATSFFGQVIAQEEVPGQKLDATVSDWRKEFAIPLDVTGFFDQVIAGEKLPGPKLNATIQGWRTQFATPIDATGFFDPIAAVAGALQKKQAEDAAATAAQADALGKKQAEVAAAVVAGKQAETAAALASHAVQSEGLAIYEQTRTAQEALGLEMTKLQGLYASGAITADTLARAQHTAAEQVGATWQQASESVAGSFTEIAGAFGRESSKMAKIARILGIVQATISMFVGAAKALELPFPANIAAVAAVLAKGAAMVASVRSQNVPAFAHGGSFKVGGQGGIDNNMVAMQLSRGERVDITPPGANDNDQIFTVKIPGFDPKKLYEGEHLRSLIEAIGGALDDGAQFRTRTMVG